MNWYKIQLEKEAMALDPNAWSYDSQPSRLQMHQEQVRTPFGIVHQRQDETEIEDKYFGVHLTPNENLAAIYALNKANENDPPVLIEIDPHQHNKKTDVDAGIEATKLGHAIDDIKEKVNKILARKDLKPTQKRAEILEELFEAGQFWSNENDGTAFVDVVTAQEETSPYNVIHNYLEPMNMKDFAKSLKDILSGNIPDALLIASVQQYRITESVPVERVRAIYQIPWIDPQSDLNEYYDEEEEEDDENDVLNEEDEEAVQKPKRVTYEDVEYGGWLKKKTLYKNNQLYFDGFSSEDSVWHGTTLSRAKQAFPELFGIGVTANSTSMIKKAQIWKYKPQHELSIDEDNPDDASGLGFNDKVQKFYEMEYKLHTIRTKPFSGMPKRKENIINNIENVLNNVCDVLLVDLISVYQQWLGSHALVNPSDWANSRLEELDGWGSNAIKHAADEMFFNAYPDSNYNSGNAKSLLLAGIKQEINNMPNLSNAIRAYLKENKTELLNDGIERFNIQFNTNYATEEEAEQAIHNQDVDSSTLIQEFFDYNDEETLGYIVENSLTLAEEIFSVVVFKSWMDRWGPEGIVETRENVERIFKLMKSAQGSNVKDKCAAISLGLNAAHQTGSMTDYMEGGNMEELLQNMTNGAFIEKANKELREVGVQI